MRQLIHCAIVDQLLRGEKNVIMQFTNPILLRKRKAVPDTINQALELVGVAWHGYLGLESKKFTNIFIRQYHSITIKNKEKK